MCNPTVSVLVCYVFRFEMALKCKLAARSVLNSFHTGLDLAQRIQVGSDGTEGNVSTSSARQLFDEQSTFFQCGKVVSAVWLRVSKYLILLALLVSHFWVFFILSLQRDSSLTVTIAVLIVVFRNVAINIKALKNAGHEHKWETQLLKQVLEFN